jgi:hypothetical protein
MKYEKMIRFLPLRPDSQETKSCHARLCLAQQDNHGILRVGLLAPVTPYPIVIMYVSSIITTVDIVALIL